jgi:hypothetical protein
VGERERERLTTVLRERAAEAACWERAETVLRAEAVRERLRTLGIDVTPDVAVAIMAAAVALADGTDEWGGDYRDALGDLGSVALALLEG